MCIMIMSSGSDSSSKVKDRRAIDAQRVIPCPAIMGDGREWWARRAVKLGFGHP
jgi:hypothetical protein